MKYFPARLHLLTTIPITILVGTFFFLKISKTKLGVKNPLFIYDPNCVVDCYMSLEMFETKLVNACNASDEELRKTMGLGGAPLRPGITLLPHQRMFFEETAQHHLVQFDSLSIKGLLLGWEMGLGKTLVSVLYALATRPKGQKAPILMVVPKTLLASHPSEIRKFFSGIQVGIMHSRSIINPITPYDVVLTTYGTLASEWIGLDMDNIRKRRVVGFKDEELVDTKAKYFFGQFFHCVIYDESGHMLCKWGTTRTQAALNIRSRRTICLSGTPIVNSYDDLRVQLACMGHDPNVAQVDLKHIFFSLTKVDAGLKLPEKTKEVHVVTPNRVETKCILAGHIRLRMIKCMISKLRRQGSQGTEAYIRLTNALHEVHTYLSMLSLAGACINRNSVFRLLAKFKIQEDIRVHFMDREGVLGKKSSKVQAVAQFVGSLDCACGIFSPYIGVLNMLKEVLEEQGVDVYIITGKTELRERMQIIQYVNKRAKDQKVVLLATSKLGMGWNCTNIHVGIMVAPEWTQATTDQCGDRFHRIGQTQIVHMHYFQTKGSLEVDKDRSSKRKASILDQAKKNKTMLSAKEIKAREKKALEEAKKEMEKEMAHTKATKTAKKRIKVGAPQEAEVSNVDSVEEGINS